MICTKSSVRPYLKISLWFFLLTRVVLSAPVIANTVFISEIYPAPQSGESEWFELFNAGDSVIDLSGWTAFDQLSTATLLIALTNSMLKPYQALVVPLSGSKLNNAGDGITLYDSSGQLVDAISYSSSEAGLSWHRAASESAELFLGTANPGEWTPIVQSTQTPTSSPTQSFGTPLPTWTPPHTSPSPTPTTQASPAPTPGITGLLISEVLSCPISPETEWVELWNTQDQTVSLEQWSIADAQDNRVTFSQQIPAYQFAVISWNKALLNNSGDTLSLLNHDNQLQEQLEIPSCLMGHSFALLEGAYSWVNPPTKGRANAQGAVANSPTPSTVGEASSLESPAVTLLQPTRFVTPTLSNDSKRLTTSRPFSIFEASASGQSPVVPEKQSPIAPPPTTPQIPIWSYLSVIMGGGLMSLAGWFLYAHQDHTFTG